LTEIGPQLATEVGKNKDHYKDFLKESSSHSIGIELTKSNQDFIAPTTTLYSTITSFFKKQLEARIGCCR